MPALKKPGLDVTNVQSYRPISNLSVVSKRLERIVASDFPRFVQGASTSDTLIHPAVASVSDVYV